MRFIARQVNFWLTSNGSRIILDDPPTAASTYAFTGMPAP
jgi:hypothetical protein